MNEEIRRHLNAAMSAAGSQMAHLRELEEALDAPEPAPEPEPEPEPAPAPEPAPVATSCNAVPAGTSVTQQSLRTLWAGRGITTPTGDVTANTTFLTYGHEQKHTAGRNGPGVNYGANLPDGGAPHVIGEWTIALSPNFSFGTALLGGKLGGFGIGDPVVGGNGTPELLANGGSLRLTWHARNNEHVNNDAVFRPYAYHRSQVSKYGDGEPTDVAVERGKPLRVRMEIDIPKGMGIIWVNDQLIHEGLYDWPRKLLVSRFLAHVYHGGGTNDWGPTVNCTSQLRDARIWVP